MVRAGTMARRRGGFSRVTVAGAGGAAAGGGGDAAWIAGGAGAVGTATAVGGGVGAAATGGDAACSEGAVRFGERSPRRLMIWRARRLTAAGSPLAASAIAATASRVKAASCRPSVALSW